MKALLFTTILFLAGGALIGCSDDDPAAPEPITIADLAGSWNCTMYKATSSADPQIEFDLIALGGSLSVTVGSDGSFTGQAGFPDPDTGQLDTVPIQGTFSLPSQTTLSMQFVVEIPPFLENEIVEFTLSGNLLQLYDESTTFDFDFDGDPDTATFEATLVRS